MSGSEEDHYAFLRSIVNSPNANLPRLVYADWLEENGDVARAEFIRLSCEMRELSLSDPRQHQLGRRWDRLASLHEETWLDPLRQLGGSWRIHRGDAFAEEVTMRACDFLKHADTIYRLTPLHRWHLCEARGWVSALASRPEWAYCTWLHLWGCEFILPDYPTQVIHTDGIGDEGVYELAHSLGAEQLRGLRLPHNSLTDAGVAELVRWPSLRRLQHLDLSGNDIGDIGLMALAEVPFADLQVLELQDNSFGEAGLAALSVSPSLTKLTRLRLGPVQPEEVPIALRVRFPGRLELR